MDNGMKSIPETQNASKKLNRPNTDRIAINKSNTERLNRWIEQAQEQINGIKINRTELLNCLIELHDDLLNAAEITEINKRFFDEVKFAEWMTQELRAARNRGENISLQELMTKVCPAQKQKRGRKKQALKPDKEISKQEASS